MAHRPTPPEEYWTRLKSKQGEMWVALTMVTLAGSRYFAKLAAGFIAVHLEEAAFRTANEPKFVVAISFNSVPRRIFKMVEPDITGQSLFARLLRIHAPKSPVLNSDTFVN
jgi:hypothetical protein